MGKSLVSCFFLRHSVVVLLLMLLILVYIKVCICGTVYHREMSACCIYKCNICRLSICLHRLCRSLSCRACILVVVAAVTVVTFCNKNFDNRKATFGNQTSESKCSIDLNAELKW